MEKWRLAGILRVPFTGLAVLHLLSFSRIIHQMLGRSSSLLRIKIKDLSRIWFMHACLIMYDAWMHIKWVFHDSNVKAIFLIAIQEYIVLRFQKMSGKIQFYCLNGLTLTLIWLIFVTYILQKSTSNMTVEV